VADDEHVVLFAKGNVAIGRFKIERIGFWMDGFPFENVFGADGVELRFDEGG